jgi:hypothetical protein
MLTRKIQVLFAALSFTLALGACVGSEVDSEAEAESDVAEAESPLPTTACSIFYLNAPGGDMVGYCITSCNGGKSCKGTKTLYFERDCESCSDYGGGSGGDPGCYDANFYCPPEYGSCVSCQGCYTSGGYCSPAYSSCVWC